VNRKVVEKGEAMQWYVEVLKKYAVFSGRARRKELWMFALISFLIALALSIIEFSTGLYDATTNLGYLSSIYGLAVLLPSLAVGVRRLHDTGRSGLWILIGLVPLVGAIVLIVFYVIEGDAGENEYGPNPKQMAAPQPA
jgi:uncharacterized membrane protein YhaH (DUF805 family)